jgi:hypothetical protein
VSNSETATALQIAPQSRAHPNAAQEGDLAEKKAQRTHSEAGILNVEIEVHGNYYKVRTLLLASKP